MYISLFFIALKNNLLIFISIDNRYQLELWHQPELHQMSVDLDHNKLRKLICDFALADENEHILSGLIPTSSDSAVVNVEEWIQNMNMDGFHCDYAFIQLTSNYFKRDIIVIPIIKEDGNNGTGKIEIKARQNYGNPPFYLLNFYNYHFQSIIPK